MSKMIDRLKLIFLGVFALACAGAWGYQILVVGPAKRCEAAGNWWDREGRQCATPVDLRTFPRLSPPPGSRDGGTPAAAAARTAPARSSAPAPAH